VLKRILHEPPMVTVMLGPPSTGKTRLMNRVVSSLKADGTPEFHALNINLRGVTLNTGKEFWDYIGSNSRIASDADKAWKLFAETASKIRALKFFGLKVDLEEWQARNLHILDSFVGSVPTWTGGSGIPFVLVIDEANALKKLASKDYSVSLYFGYQVVD